MAKAVLVLASQAQRDTLAHWAKVLPLKTRVWVEEPGTRSTDQNAMMWSLIGDIAKQLLYHGQKMDPDDWKLVFISALDREQRVVPSLDGRGFVLIGRSTSQLKVAQMADLITLIIAWGTEQGVKFKALGDFDDGRR